MRVLDSKAEEDREIIKNAPSILEYLAGDDKNHFDELQNLLRSVGISFTVDPMLVRGIDYYTRTVFEITSSDLGAQDALCGGGRYDNLVEQLGGPPTPAIGFGAGVERLLIALEKARGITEIVAAPSIYVVAQSGTARTKVLETTSLLRQNKFRAICDLNNRSMKAQMREANREGTKFVFIIGESELAEGAGMLKNMSTSEQTKVSFDKIVEAIKEAVFHNS